MITRACMMNSITGITYKSIHDNRDIFCDKMVLIFFMNNLAKPHVKKVYGQF